MHSACQMRAFHGKRKLKKKAVRGYSCAMQNCVAHLIIRNNGSDELVAFITTGLPNWCKPVAFHSCQLCKPICYIIQTCINLNICLTTVTFPEFRAKWPSSNYVLSLQGTLSCFRWMEDCTDRTEAYTSACRQVNANFVFLGSFLIAVYPSPIIIYSPEQSLSHKTSKF